MERYTYSNVYTFPVLTYRVYMYETKQKNKENRLYVVCFLQLTRFTRMQDVRIS